MRALVTGASRGIGKAVAEALLRAGYEVTGTSRDPAAVPTADRIPGVSWLPLDLRSERSIAACAASAGRVDVLVNNAGGSQIAPVEELPLERMRSLFEMNLFGVVRLTQLILPGMRARRSGRIVSISSFSAATPVPFQASYAASKAAVVALFRGMRHEVAPWGVRVSVVAPLDVRTSIPLEVCYDKRSAYLPAVQGVRVLRDRYLEEGVEPSTIAETVLRLLRARRPRFFVAAGRHARLSLCLARHLPEGIVESIVRRRYGLRAHP